MIPPPVVGSPVRSRVLLIGQAPGVKEPVLKRPFAWTAGKNLFKWLGRLGVDEATFRARVYMAAVCRCFPGKNPKGGDRVPDENEIANCRPWLDRELELLRPELLIPVGKLAIAQVSDVSESDALTDHIGQKKRIDGRDIIALPHPSGASTWYHRDPGKSLLAQALELIGDHPAWRATFRD